MKYLSVCSGIEAASVAWHSLGWKPLAFSEIEPFPRAVLAHHYPDVPCHGDFTVLRDQPWIVDADVLVGGTPCQAFSVAGLRNSLSDERGNLSLEFVRLADAIDAFRSGAGREPGVIVWENVPGVLSVKDNAFGCFLAALAGDVTSIDPPRGKWSNAGVVDGPQRKVAWRILDAQYFGLAQRRRRVFVVASARDGFDPAAVLLEFEGVRRDTAPRRETGQAASGGATGRAGGGGVTEQLSDSLTVGANQTTGFSSPSVVGYSHWDDPNAPHPTLNQSHNTGGVGQSNQELFSQRGAYLVQEPVIMSSGQANAEIRTDGGAPVLTCLHEAPIIAGALLAGGHTNNPLDETLVTHALRAEGFDASEDGTGRGTPLVPMLVGTMKANNGGGGWSNSADHAAAGYMVPVALSFKPGQSEAAGATFVTEEFAPTLQAQNNGSTAVPAVVYSIMPQNSGRDYKAREVEVAQPIMAGGPVGGNQGGDYVLMPVAFHPTQDPISSTDGTTHAIGCGSKNGQASVAVTYPINTQIALRHQALGERTGMGIGEPDDPSFTLQAAHCHAVAITEPYTLAIRGRGDTHNLEARQDGTANALLTPNGGRGGIGVGAVAAGMAVRRLTPVECERLQGFPDNFTQIPWKKKPADQCPDGPRYKALGNSMAVPVMRWIGKRISQHLRGEI